MAAFHNSAAIWKHRVYLLASVCYENAIEFLASCPLSVLAVRPAALGCSDSS